VHAALGAGGAEYAPLALYLAELYLVRIDTAGAQRMLDAAAATDANIRTTPEYLRLEETLGSPKAMKKIQKKAARTARR